MVSDDLEVDRRPHFPEVAGKSRNTEEIISVCKLPVPIGRQVAIKVATQWSGELNKAGREPEECSGRHH